MADQLEEDLKTMREMREGLSAMLGRVKANPTFSESSELAHEELERMARTDTDSEVAAEAPAGDAPRSDEANAAGVAASDSEAPEKRAEQE
jgi:hypothetical protein